jgi:hypothetical protein
MTYPYCAPCLQSNAALTQQLADSNHLLEALREEAAEMTGQLSAAEASLAAKDTLIQQLKGLVASGEAAGGAASEAGAGVLDMSTSGSTPSTRSPSKALSRQTSRAGANGHATVGQVRSSTASLHGACCGLMDGCGACLVGCACDGLILWTQHGRAADCLRQPTAQPAVSFTCAAHSRGLHAHAAVGWC